MLFRKLLDSYIHFIKFIKKSQVYIRVNRNNYAAVQRSPAKSN